MSFRLYFQIEQTSAETEIYNNTELIASYSDFDQIVVVGINNNLTSNSLIYTNSGANQQYVTVDLPVYQIKSKKGFQYRPQHLASQTRANFEAFRTAVMGSGADYLLVYINNLNGNQVEDRIINFLTRHTGITKLQDKSRGGWAVLLKPSARRQTRIESFEILREHYNLDSQISLYYLTNTELSYVDRTRWNQLFISNSQAVGFYTEVFQQLDSFLYHSGTSYVQILSRINQHITTSPDSNFDGLAEEASSNAYYDSYPNQLLPDQTQLRNIIESSSRLAKEAGIPKLDSENGRVVINTRDNSRFLSSSNRDSLQAFRSLYLAIRTEFVNELGLVL